MSVAKGCLRHWLFDPKKDGVWQVYLPVTWYAWNNTFLSFNPDRWVGTDQVFSYAATPYDYNQSCDWWQELYLYASLFVDGDKSRNLSLILPTLLIEIKICYLSCLLILKDKMSRNHHHLSFILLFQNLFDIIKVLNICGGNWSGNSNV